MSAQPIIERHQLLNAALGSRNVSNVDIRRITLGPGQKSGRHLHPCSVVGYIASGTAFYQIEGEAAEGLLPVGSAFRMSPRGASSPTSATPPIRRP